jgi:hypothetical protein
MRQTMGEEGGTGSGTWVWEAYLRGLKLQGLDNVEVGPFRIRPSSPPPITPKDEDQGPVGSIEEFFGRSAILAAWAPYKASFVGESRDHTGASNELQQLIGILRLWKTGGLQPHGLWEHSGLLETAEFGGRAVEVRGRPWVLDRQELNNLREFFNALYPIDYGGFSIAWKRFDSYYSRLDDQDAFIDLMVALEAAFGDGGEAIRYKIALRTACFLEQDDKSRKAAYKFVTEAYTKRSGVLHGSLEAREWASANLDGLEGLVRRTLIGLARQAKSGAVPTESRWDDFLFWPKA